MSIQIILLAVLLGFNIIASYMNYTLKSYKTAIYCLLTSLFILVVLIDELS